MYDTFPTPPQAEILFPGAQCWGLIYYMCSQSMRQDGEGGGHVPYAVTITPPHGPPVALGDETYVCSTVHYEI